uniref:Uncharacterized protein n=1 Tax=Chromera velia CCMP2878 TaxID=1169474 RepID=A0A0G4G204_9ALVE|eukprot:Cvel_19863.t1-p1 / transcript=Cvel_19863.t1 / gene=Cvel_19863 / organism=Chromera_velia_CCMP2878 / gene_product=hypothetical protein / transcript_product=hypothetical protein / location=Cvel_scaffold1741:8876-16254(+) / protein_length=1669 / sequence_SO=supercontig / SO=protein_coding / is_pseudo=false
MVPSLAISFFLATLAVFSGFCRAAETFRHLRVVQKKQRPKRSQTSWHLQGGEPHHGYGIENAQVIDLSGGSPGNGSEPVPISVHVNGTVDGPGGEGTNPGFSRCGGSFRFPGRWYRLRLPGSDSNVVGLAVDACNSPINTDVGLLSGDCAGEGRLGGSCSCVGSQAFNERRCGWEKRVPPATVGRGGDEFFLLVSGSLSHGVFSMNVTVTPLPPPPENDEITGALSIPMKGFLVPLEGPQGPLTLSRSSGTVEGSLLASSNNDHVWSGTEWRAGVWYRVEVEEESVLKVEASSDQGTEMSHRVLKGTECLSTPSRRPCSCYRGFRGPALPGTYFVWVFSDSAAALTESSSAFNLTVTTTKLPPAPENDVISGAVAVPIADVPVGTPVSVAGSLLNSSRDSIVCRGSPQAGVWYSVEVNETSALSVAVNPDPAEDEQDDRKPKAYVFEGLQCLSDPSRAPCACLTDGYMGKETQAVRASAATTFFVLVYSDREAAQDENASLFNLTLTATPIPPAPENDAIAKALKIKPLNESVLGPSSGPSPTPARSSATVRGSLFSATLEHPVCAPRLLRAGVWYSVDVNETSALSVAVDSDEAFIRAHVLKGSACLSSPSNNRCICVTSDSRGRRTQTVRAPPDTYLVWVFADGDASLSRSRSAFSLSLSTTALPAPENDSIDRAVNLLMPGQRERAPSPSSAGHGSSLSPTAALSVTLEGSLFGSATDASVCSDDSDRVGVWYSLQVNETSALSVEVTSNEGKLYAHVLKGDACLSSPSSASCSCVSTWTGKEHTLRASAETYFVWVFAHSGTSVSESCSAFKLSVSLLPLPPPPPNYAINAAIPLSLNSPGSFRSVSLNGSFLSSAPTNAPSVCGEGGGEEGAGLWYRADLTERGLLSLRLTLRDTRFVRAESVNVLKGRSCLSDPSSAPGCECVYGVQHRVLSHVILGDASESQSFPVEPDEYFITVFTNDSRKTYNHQQSDFLLEAAFLPVSATVSPTSTELTLDAPVSGEINGSAPHSFSFLPRESGRVAITLCSSRPTSLTVLNGSATVGSADVTVCTGCGEVWVDVNEGERLCVEIPFQGGERREEGGEFFTLSARELPVPPASRWESAFELQGNQTVEFSTSVVPPGLYREGLGVFWFRHRAERQKGLSLTLCREQGRDRIARWEMTRRLAEASCSETGCEFSEERVERDQGGRDLVLQSERVSRDVQEAERCSAWYRSVDPGESVLFGALQTEFPIQSEHAGKLTLNVREFELPRNKHPSTAVVLPLEETMEVETSFAFSMPWQQKSILPANLTDASGLWYRLNFPPGREGRLQVAVGLCSDQMRDVCSDEVTTEARQATLELRVCSDGHTSGGMPPSGGPGNSSACRTVVKRDLNDKLAERNPHLYSKGCSDDGTLQTVLYRGEHLILGVGTFYNDRGRFQLRAREVERGRACVEDPRFEDAEGDGCGLYASHPEFCDAAELWALPSAFGGRSARESCCTCIGRPVPATPVRLLRGRCPQGTRRKLNACLAFDTLPVSEVEFNPVLLSGRTDDSALVDYRSYLFQLFRSDCGPRQSESSAASVSFPASRLNTEFCAEGLGRPGEVRLSAPRLLCGDVDFPLFPVGPNEQCCKLISFQRVAVAPAVSVTGCAASVDGRGQVCERVEARVEGLLLEEAGEGEDDLPDMD